MSIHHCHHSLQACAFAEALKTNSTLVRLRLGACGVTDKGALALADAVPLNTTLIKLSLNINEGVGPKGDAALIAAWQNSPNLQLLTLCSTTSINNFGGTAFKLC